MSKSVVRIDIGKVCRESFPCQHTVTVYYIDRTIGVKSMNGRSIVKEYWNVMTSDQRQHFASYTESAFQSRGF